MGDTRHKTPSTPPSTHYKSKYNEVYHGLPPEVRLEIWKHLIPPEGVYIKRISFRAGDPRPNNDDVVAARTTRLKGRSEEDPMTLQCYFEGGDSNIAILGLDRSTRAEILPLYRRKVHLCRLGVLERVAVLKSSILKVSCLVTELCIGRIVPYCVAPYHIQSSEFARFLCGGGIGVFKHVRLLRLELHVKDLSRVRPRLQDIIIWARRYCEDSSTEVQGGNGDGVLKFVVVGIDRQNDGLDEFEAQLVEAAVWAGLDCKVHWEEIEGRSIDRMMISLSRQLRLIV